MLFLHNLKVALRSLFRNRLFFGLNLTGLTLSLAGVILIALYLRDELTFDRFHPEAGRIYRVLEQRSSAEEGDQRLGSVSFNITEEGPKQVAGVEKGVRLTTLGRVVLRNETNRQAFYQEFLVAEPVFLEVFNFPLLRGDARQALTEPNRIVLSEELAGKLFGDADPIGKVLTTDRGLELTVSGVLAPLPANSHLQFDNLISLATLRANPRFEESVTADWNSNYWVSYLKLAPGAEARAVAGQLTRLVASRQPEDADPFNSTFELQPLSQIHFDSEGVESDRNSGKSSRAYVYVFGAVGLFILLIGCINYVNLMTARSSQYGKEVGIRKVVGATRRRLLGRFIAESFVVSLISFILALNLVWLTLPRLNAMTGKQLTLSFSSHNAGLPILLLGLLLLVSLLAGFYPALILSRFNPVQVLRDKATAASGGGLLRRSLVVFQFVLSTVLITATLIAFSQMQYIRKKNLGFDQDQLVVVDINSGRVRDGFATIKAGYQELPGVRSVSVSNRVPGEWKDLPQVPLRSADRPESAAVEAFFLGADEDFLATFDIQLLTGRNFDENRPGDSTSLLINEQAARLLGIAQPADQALVMDGVSFDGVFDDFDTPLQGRVIGIVKDFHFQSLHEPLRPLVIAYRNNPVHSIDYFTARLDAARAEETLAQMTEVLQSVDPNHIFEYHFLDDQLQLFYEADSRRGRLFTLAALLAIIIACLGLFGLAAYTAERRIKEIGIRKILGASVGQIVALLSREFLLLVGIALLIGLPVAWYVARQWLHEFAFNIGLKWWMFAASAGLALLIALLTVSGQAIRTALGNPVEALRSE